MSPLHRYIFPKTHLNFYYFILRGSQWSTDWAGSAQEGKGHGPGYEDQLCMQIAGSGIVSSTIVYFTIQSISQFEQSNQSIYMCLFPETAAYFKSITWRGNGFLCALQIPQILCFTQISIQVCLSFILQLLLLQEKSKAHSENL